MSNTIDTLTSIKAALSAGRISTFDTAAGVTQPSDPRGVALYAWNAQVAAYLLMPLHICEVVVRNAAADAIEAIHGTNWPWNPGFQSSLPTGRGWSPLANEGTIIRFALATPARRRFHVDEEAAQPGTNPSIENNRRSLSYQPFAALGAMMVLGAGVSAEGIRLARVASIWRRRMATEDIRPIFALYSPYG